MYLLINTKKENNLTKTFFNKIEEISQKMARDSEKISKLAQILQKKRTF